MKNTPFLLFVLSGHSVFAQQCSNYYFLQSNKTIEMSISNKKGKDAGKITYVISNVANKGSVTTATVNSEFVDKNGKSVSKARKRSSHQLSWSKWGIFQAREQRVILNILPPSSKEML
jgi:hypothetical protein